MNTDSYLHEHEVHPMDYRESDCLRAQLQESQARVATLEGVLRAIEEHARVGKETICTPAAAMYYAMQLDGVVKCCNIALSAPPLPVEDVSPEHE